MHRAINGRFDALFEVGEQITRVAAENFVPALPAEHDFAVLANQPGNHVLRKRSRAGGRVIEMERQWIGVGRDIRRVDRQRLQRKPGGFAHLRSVVALVVVGTVVEPAGKPDESFRPARRRQPRDNARIESTAHVGTNRHIATNVQPHRIFRRLPQPLFEVGRRVVEVQLVVDIPILADADRPVRNGQRVTRKELPNVLEERSFAQAELECQILFERLVVGGDVADERQQGLRFRREVQHVPHLRVIERLDPEPVARAEQLLLGFVP